MIRTELRAASSRQRTLSLVAAFCALIPLFAADNFAFAQLAGTGSIQGTVSDSTGAALPGTQVTITDEATQVTHTMKTGRDGLFSFPNLTIGNYTLNVGHDGFKTYIQQHVVLEVGSSIGENVVLTLGAVTEQVQVTATGLALQTEDTSFKQTIDERTMTELPLNGRQVTSLITLAGASMPSSTLTEGNKGWWSSVSPQIAGGQGNQSDYRLDGGDNNDYESNTSFAFPFPDALSQFSVESSVMGADTGLHPAGVINAVTKSGTNHFHGVAFDFIRNNYIDATNYFSTLKDELHQNQFGGTIGGPILHNRLFFFAGYQRLDYSSASNARTAHVPTDAMLKGDFSAAESVPCLTKGATQLLDQFTGAVLVNDMGMNTGEYNAASLALVKYLPPAEDQCGTVHYAIPTFQTENQFVTRIDATLNKRNNLYGRYFYDSYKLPAQYSPTDILVTANPGNTELAQSLTIGENWTPTNSLVNTLHLTATRRTNTRGPAAQGVNADSLGITSVYQPIPIGLREQGAGFNVYCSTCAVGTFNVNSFSIIDEVNLVLGKHQLIFGGEYIRAELNVNNSFSENGTFNFSNVFSEFGPQQNIKNISGTTVNGVAAKQGGQSLLDFLTGSMTFFSQSKPQQNAMRAPIPSLYIQDTYHLSPRVVLTGGVRWSAEFTPYDYFGRGASFNYSNFLANVHSTRFPNAPAGALFYGDPGIPKNFTQNYLWQFTPRLGLTFDPVGDGKTVFRIGGGLVYDETNFFASTEATQDPPFATLVTNTATTAPISFSNPWVGGTTPGNIFPQPFVPPSTQAFATGGQYIVYPKQFPTPYVVQWTASIQHEMPRGWQWQLDYIGNKGTHAPYGFPIAPVVYIPGTWTGPGSCVSAFGPLLTSPGTGKPCSSTSNSQARSQLTLQNPAQGPYYLAGGGGGASTLMVAGANSSYNALVASIQHRASRNFTFLANYTWSHCFDLLDNPGAFNTVAVENPYDLKRDYAACGFDRRAIFNSAIVATSHFGLSGWKDWLINNWELAPIIRATSGAPYSVTSGVDNSLTALGTNRPNWTGRDPYIHARPLSLSTANPTTLDITQFSQNAQGTYGNLARNVFLGPKTFNMDAALSRMFPVHESLQLDLRLEAFNVLNHPNFNNPSASLNSPSSFGRITGSSAARVFQGAVKIIF